MSTKVYNAYRTAEGVNLWAFVERVRGQAQANIRSNLTTFYNNMLAADRREPLAQSPENVADWKALEARKGTDAEPSFFDYTNYARKWQHEYDGDKVLATEIRESHKLAPEKPLRYYHCYDYVWKQMRAQADDAERSRWDPAASVHIIPFEGRYLVRPFTNGCSVVTRDVLEFLVDDSDLAYFGYWDNSDPDENTTEAEWEERGRIWDTVFARGSYPYSPEFARAVTIDICDVSSFHLIDPHHELDLKAAAAEKAERENPQ